MDDDSDDPIPPRHPLAPIVARSLARGLEALAARTEAPLRVRAHATSRGCELFDVVEEPELGARGRRFLVSVDTGPAGSAMLVGVG